VLQDRDLLISVRDTGVGIEPELLPEIFEPFLQGSRTLDRSQGGLGIGLTLVRTLVEMHGGTVTAQSAGTGQGSEFVVVLPLRTG
jgi:signal transduction histidine kinase